MDQGQNNFNTQGNNGIPNNQPLQNNQNFNNIFNQGVHQSSGVNPQTFSSQSQTTMNYQQPSNQMNTQQPTPQTINSFESGNTNNQSFNSKPPKKLNLGLIIGIVAAIAVIGVGLFFGIKLFSNKSIGGNPGNNSSATKVEQAKITGKTELTKSFEGYTKVSSCGNYYFTLENDENLIVVDYKGRTVASGNVSYNKPYCYDDGTIMINTNKKGEPYSKYEYSVWRDGKEIHSFESHNNETNYYENNVIYYTTSDAYIIAYDLKSKKELWKSQVIAMAPIVLEDVVVADGMMKDSYVVINKKTGETIAQSTDSNTIYVSYSDYYIKTFEYDDYKNLDYLEVYDYDSNLISKLDLNNEEHCKFSYILSNGYYVVSCDSSDYSVYDYNSNPIKQNLNRFDYEDSRYVKNNKIFTSINILDNKNVSVVEADKYSKEPSLIFYNEGKTINYFSYADSWSFSAGVGNTGSWGDTSQRTFLFGRNESYGEEAILTNFLTGKQVNIGNLQNKYAHVELDNHFVIRDNDKYIFYDKELNKLEYQADKTVYPIANEWVLLYSMSCEKSFSCDSKFAIANILTGEEKELSLDIDRDKLKAEMVVNRNGVITRTGDVYNLYQFN